MKKKIKGEKLPKIKKEKKIEKEKKIKKKHVMGPVEFIFNFVSLVFVLGIALLILIPSSVYASDITKETLEIIFNKNNIMRQITEDTTYDEIIKIGDTEAVCEAKKLAGCEGVLVGISSGAALCAASKLAKMPQNKDKNIVVLLPDTGERYMSTSLFD